MGALRPAQAEIDAAHARGYAHGLEEARADALDQSRTLLMTLLEKRFGELGDAHLDRIGDADGGTLEKWTVAVIASSSLDEVFLD